MRAVRVDSGTRILCHFPIGPVFQQGLVKGPEGADFRFDRMDQASLPMVIEYATVVGSRLDADSSQSPLAVFGNEGLGRHSQKFRDPFYLFFFQKDAAFSIAACTAQFTFEGFHGEVPNPPEADESELRCLK